MDSIDPRSLGADPYGTYRPVSPIDDSDGEEERRRLGADVVDRWLG